MTGLANALTLAEVDSLVGTFKAEGKLITIKISAGGEPTDRISLHLNALHLNAH
jgi:hypothetical protein